MIIELKNAKKIYGKRTVLDLDSLEFREAGTYAVIGPNGSGKTTLLKLIAGIVEMDDGQILYDGGALNSRKYISYLPQKPYIFDMTILENICSGIKERSDCKKTAWDAIINAGLENIAGINARSVSGGEAQKTAVLRTLVLDREVILLDEPAASIDIANMERIEECIRSMRRKSSTVIFTTHDPSQALRLADTVLVLMDGRLVEKGPAEDVLGAPVNEATRAFLNNWNKGLLKQ